ESARAVRLGKVLVLTVPEIVEHCHVGSGGHQEVHQVGANESSPAGNQHTGLGMGYSHEGWSLGRLGRPAMKIIGGARGAERSSGGPRPLRGAFTILWICRS